MSKLRISLAHPTGNPYAGHAVLALQEAHLLHEVVTSFAYNPHGKLARYLSRLPARIRNPISRELGRRDWIAGAGIPVRTHPWQEVMRVALVKTGLSHRLGLGQQGPIDWVYASLDRHVAQQHLKQANAIYAYEDGAATTFATAKQRGLLCFYDLPILFYRTSRAIQAEEAERFPQFASVLQATREPAWKLERKEQEVQLADHIFVSSALVRSSLLEAGVTPEKISVIPYGAPVDYFYPQASQEKPFRALFVGRVGPRKGVHYLRQAWQELRLPKAELWLVGVNEFPEGWLEQYRELLRHVPSVPHAALNQYYNSASVLVLPSLVEGFGMVLLEAMACGIPVITTPNTAGPEILVDGQEGFIVPIRDVEALKEKLEWCYQHPSELAEMGRAARRRAEQLSWNLYRQRLANRVQEIWHHHTGS